MTTKVNFKGYYDGIFAAVVAICNPVLGSRQAKFGNEVICTGIGCEMFFPAFHYKGLIPVFIDVNLDTLLPDLDVIETCIVEGKTKAVLFSYPMGNSLDLEKLRDICDEYSVFMIEYTLGDKTSGSADLRLSKTHDGFDVCVKNNPVLENSILNSAQIFSEPSGKYKISHERISCELEEYKKYLRFQYSSNCPDWYGFSITVKETASFDKYSLANHLRENGVQVRFIESATTLLQPSLKNIKHVIFQDLVNSDVAMRDTLWIPLWQNKKEEYIAKKIKEFMEKNS